MNKSDLFQAFDGIDDDILARSEAPVSRRRAPRVRRWGALAACIVLVTVLGGLAVAAEAKEYHAAMEFFEEYGLSTAGLSRADVKAVYQDIITQRFAYGKTAEVIEQAVPGVEIIQREPSPEELEALWNRNVWSNAQPGAGISYRTEYRYRLDLALGFDVLKKSILECYRDGDLLWETEFMGLVVDGSAYTSAGTAVWGHTYRWSSEQPSYGWIARVDESGSVLWQRQMEHGFHWEDVAQVLDNGDGTWAVIGKGWDETGYLCLSQYNIDGNELSFRQTEVGQAGIRNAARLGDGYLVQIRDVSWSMPTQETEQMAKLNKTERVAKLDRDGNLIDNFTYGGEDCDYYLTDMIEFGSRVYLSAYAAPKQVDRSGRSEIADILDYVFERENWEISGEELTPLVRDNYTAVLLLCDSEGGAPRTFYSVKGSLGGTLNVNDAGELVWEVESIADTFFSPMTGSFTIGGVSEVFRYAFDAAGNLLRQEDTGETVPYRK